MTYIYTVVFILALPLILVRLWFRGKNQPAYRARLKERFGLIPVFKHEYQKTVWVHTVSVGEFIAASSIIKQLLDDGDVGIVVTTTTPTGSTQVKNTFNDRVFHVYAPYDIPLFIRWFLNKTRPTLAVFLETELWPNTLAVCSKKAIPTLLINARLSEKSAKGYKKFSVISRPMLNRLSYAAIQNNNDAKRFYQLGLDKNKATVTGNIKFDVALTQSLKDQADDIKNTYTQNGKYLIFIAASTHEGEDSIIVNAYIKMRKKFPNLRLLLVPRHPDRFESVFNLCKNHQLNTIKRSSNEAVTDLTHVILGDTMGELFMLYGTADIAFVGGSLINNGGHSYIEPAAWCLPIISGPSQYNFLDTARQLDQNGALYTVKNEKQLITCLELLIKDKNLRREAGLAGKEIVEKNKGALAKTVSLIRQQLDSL